MAEAAKIAEEMADKKKRAAPKTKGKPAPAEMNKIPLRLAAAIEEWESAHGEKLSQHDLARKAGVSQPVISKLANKATLKGVAASSILRVCKALNCDVAWFLTGVGGQRIPRYRAPEVESPTEFDAEGVTELHEPLTGPPASPTRPPSSEQASRP